MRHGMSPTEAAEKALRRIVEYHKKFEGALVAVTKDGQYGKIFVYRICHSLLVGCCV